MPWRSDGAYVVRRIGISVVQLLGVAFFAFMLIHFVPGNPIATMLGPRATPREIHLVSARLGLAKPLPEQFWLFLGHLVTFHFGQSITFSQSISSLIAQRAVPSIALISYGTIVAIVLGVPLAVIAALKARPRPTRGSSVHLGQFRDAHVLVGADPGHHLRPQTRVVAGVRLRHGLRGDRALAHAAGDRARLSLLAVIVRTLRSSIRHTMSLEYVEAARARGFSTRRVLIRHVFRNAVMPTVTVLAVSVGFLIGGTVVLEQVFQIPGLGTLLFEAVEQRDYPLVETLAVLAGSLVVLLNLGTDLLQAAVDPRVRPGAKSV